MSMRARTIYLEPEIDEALEHRAKLEKITKQELIRRFIEEGLRRPSKIFKRKRKK